MGETYPASKPVEVQDLNLMEAGVLFLIAALESEDIPIILDKHSNILEITGMMWGMGLVDMVKLGDNESIRITLTELGDKIASRLSYGIAGDLSGNKRSNVLSMIESWSEGHYLEGKKKKATVQ